MHSPFSHRRQTIAALNAFGLWCSMAGMVGLGFLGGLLLGVAVL